jgi:DNA-binding FadR family transcriptional regulator
MAVQKLKSTKKAATTQGGSSGRGKPVKRAPHSEPVADGSEDDQALSPRRLKRSERLARQIASELLSDRPAVGTPLPDEKVMADEYGVARSTLREALRLLESWGVLTVKTGRAGGPLVTMPQPSDPGVHIGVVMQAAYATIGDLMDAREVMDGLMARRAAIHITDQQLEELSITLREMKASVAKPQGFRKCTARYYDILLDASHNRALAVLSGSLRTISALVLAPLPYTEEWREQSIVLRRRIMRSLAAGNSDDAESRMLEFRSQARAYYQSFDSTLFDRPIDVLETDGAE